MQRLNISREGGSNVNAPALSHNTMHGSINTTTNIHDHGTGTSTLAQPTYGHDTTSSIAKYKESVKSSYEMVMEYNSRSEESVFLSERYLELSMVECHREPGEREKSLKERQITVEQLFRPDGSGCVPKAVILQGNSGYGKSFTAQKIMLDWASGVLFNESFDLVLHLKCKEINEMSEECSLVDLLNYSSIFSSDIADMLRDPEMKVLFLVDGFDEFNFWLEDDKSPPPKDPLKTAPVQATLKALLKGHILPNCHLLLSTRSNAKDELSCLVTDSQRFVDILGFNEEAVKDYFHRFFCDMHVGDTMFELVKTTQSLYTACFIPVICWVTCIVFREQVQKGVHISTKLETATSIFARIVSTLLKHQSLDLSLPLPSLLSSLGQLAEKGMQENRVLFSQKDVLNVASDPDKGALLCKHLVNKTVQQEEMFSFMHLSFQEFFTALHYTLHQDEEMLKRLLDSDTHNNWQTQCRPVIQFLFGLANTKLIKNLDDLQLTPYTSSIRGHLEKWIMKEIQHVKNESDTTRALFILHCLNELHEEEFVKKAMDDWGSLFFSTAYLTRMDCWVLRYCLLCCPTIKRLEFFMCPLTEEMLMRLQPALSMCEALELVRCSITVEGCATLASTLTTNPSSHLVRLNLASIELGDSGVKHISDLLRNPNCKLQTLRFGCCSITAEGCVALASALTSNPSHLIQLDLSSNYDLGDSGVKHISDLLRNCQLQTLKLRCCSMTAEGSAALTSALTSNPSSHLVELDLSSNELGDSGVKQISDLLRNANCKLQTLSCSYLAAALSSNPSSPLTELDLGGNGLDQSDVKPLSALQKDSAYKLTTIEVDWGDVGDWMTQMPHATGDSW
ncbi:NACHT, LRR and PYD domains-containing protein 12-like isoform X2 [Engraulis encrasicolus]|uniref:NACHT, LRR and PYD domains-containing protein 12-like isoform X2 n=1 Tax=Engraulis encrasicolus TaxID=184585 RepID=UPI002FD0F208